MWRLETVDGAAETKIGQRATTTATMDGVKRIVNKIKVPVEKNV